MSKRKTKKELARGLAVVPPPPERTEVPEASARAFAGAGTARRHEERGERLGVYVPPELAEGLRIECARRRRSLSDAVAEALAMWLEAKQTR